MGMISGVYSTFSAKSFNHRASVCSTHTHRTLHRTSTITNSILLLSSSSSIILVLLVYTVLAGRTFEEKTRSPSRDDRPRKSIKTETRDVRENLTRGICTRARRNNNNISKNDIGTISNYCELQGSRGRPKIDKFACIILIM